MYSSCDTLAGGFPHSDISGSKLICQLPEAFRRLSRPSSPVIAKASTTCTYSLDPITLTSTLADIVKERFNPSGLGQGQILSIYVFAVLSTRVDHSTLLMSGDAINYHWRHGALSTLHAERFPPMNLIRLYELLKNNSQLSMANQNHDP